MASSGWQAWNTLATSSFGYDYFKCSIRIDSITHSGNTVTVSGAFGVKNDGGYESYYVFPVYASVENSGSVQVLDRNQHITTNSTVTAGFSMSFSASAGTTSKTVTVNWSYNNGTASNAYNYTLYFDASYSAPTGLAVSITERYTDGAKFNVSVTGYGNPSSENGRFIEAGILGQNSYGSNYRYAKSTNVTSAAITVNNSSTQGGTLTIASNTQYYYGAYASNTQRNTSKVQGQFYTLPSAPTATNFQQLTSTSASFTVTETSTGSGQSCQLQYCYKAHSASSYGGWTNVGSTGNHQSGTVTLTGLSAGSAYDVKVRTKAGSSDYSAESTYANAFTLLKPTISITGVSYAYDSGTDGCICTFSYTISAVGTGTETYTINYTNTASDSTSTTGSFSNKPVSGTFALTLPRGVSYTLSAKVGSTGQATTYTYTSADFSPTVSFGTPTKDKRGNVLTFKVSGSMGLNAGTHQDNVLTLSHQFYDSTNNSWVAGSSSSSSGNISQSFSNKTFTMSRSSEADKHLPRYTKIKAIITATNKFGISASATQIVQMPVFISGKIVPPAGSKKNIVGVMIKDKNGNITAGRYYQPFVVK